MKSKMISIPIYGGKLIVIVSKDINLIAKMYKQIVDASNYGAFTFKDDSQYRTYIMVLEDGWRSNVVHELVHVVNYIYLDCAMQLDRNNDEPQAYLMGWLYHEIDKFLTDIENGSRKSY